MGYLQHVFYIVSYYLCEHVIDKIIIYHGKKYCIHCFDTDAFCVRKSILYQQSPEIFSVTFIGPKPGNCS